MFLIGGEIGLAASDGSDVRGSGCAATVAGWGASSSAKVRK
jgi:hypothetical protein